MGKKKDMFLVRIQDNLSEVSTCVQVEYWGTIEKRTEYGGVVQCTPSDNFNIFALVPTVK
jgi:hypothetical protein